MEPRQDTSKRRWQQEGGDDASSLQFALDEAEGSKRPRLGADDSENALYTQDPRMIDAGYATQFTTQFTAVPESTAPPLRRALDMYFSPEMSRRDGQINGAGFVPQTQAFDDAASSIVDFSSPVKERETRVLPEAFRPDTQFSSGSGAPARVAGWILPDVPEIWEERTLDIDPNGDDDVVTTQVQDILRPPVAQDEDAPFAAQMIRPSQPDATSRHPIVHSTASQPGQSTPPPPRSRRRAAASKTNEASINGTSGAQDVPAGVPNTVDLSDSVEAVTNALASPYTKESRTVITRLVQTSPLVPAFLKAEIIALLRDRPYEASPQEISQTDSETQDDGYLQTKATWIFELCKISAEDSVIGGDDLLADVSADVDAIVLSIQMTTTTSDYSLQRAAREQVLQWRASVQTNAWFDASGQPFAVTFRSPHLEASSGSSGPFVHTQGASMETQQLRQELESMTKAHDRIAEELAVVNASNEATQEQLDLIRRLYDDATSLASQAEKEASELRHDNEALRFQVANSVKITQGLADERIARLQSSLRSVTQQRDLLMRQNELTNDKIREKASAWEEYEARREQEQRRRERAEAARLETHLALQATILGNEVSRRPQDYLLAVDLAAQRRSLDDDAAEAGPSRSGGAEGSTPADAGVNDEDEDELAALQREAEQLGGDDLAINTEAPRARRSRLRRSASRSQPARSPKTTMQLADIDELAAFQEEAAAADHANSPMMLAVPLEGSSRSTRRSSSRRSASQAAGAGSDTSNVTPGGGKELSLPASPYLGARTRARSRPPLDPGDAMVMAEVLAQNETDAQNATSHALEAEFAAYDEARAAGTAAAEDDITNAV